MTEDYVSLETAKLLKEKGFEGECSIAYFNETLVDYTMFGLCLGGDLLYCPTLQMAMKWLRKEKGIAIIPVISSILDNEKFLWDIKIVVAKTNETYSQGWIYEEPEEAYETAIKYALENLI